MLSLLLFGSILILLLLVLGVAPTYQARVLPTGTKMTDGFSTKITIGTGASQAALWIWEQTVMPPGYEGGDKIPTTTMLNVTWRTFAPHRIKEMTDVTFTAAYDPGVLGVGGPAGVTIQNLINVNQSISITWPNTSDTVAFWGYLKTFKIKEHKEGEMPIADGTITVTNTDTSTNAEAGPVWAATGT